MARLDISVIIPTLNAQDRIASLLDALAKQTVKPAEVLVVDSSSEDATVEVASSFDGVRVTVISRSTFNHGTTRHEAILQTSGKLVGFLSDDAIPADEFYLEHIVTPFANDRVAVASGRQLPKPDARRFEQLVRQFNYGEEGHIRSLEDMDKYGAKAFFTSDSCSMYRRDAYLEAGGFPPVGTNEDMIMAARLARAGWLIAYAADAAVLHSHNLTPFQQYRRNYTVGEFLETYDVELAGDSELDEGKRLVGSVSRQLVSEHAFGELAAFGVDCAARLLGNRMGRRHARRQLQKGAA